jgi:hypothetical protein
VAFVTQNGPDRSYEGDSPSDDVWAPLVKLSFEDAWEERSGDEIWLRWAHHAAIVGTAGIFTGDDYFGGTSNLIVRNVSPYGMIVDTLCSDRRLTGARYFCEQKVLSLETAWALWPEYKKELEKLAVSRQAFGSLLSPAVRAPTLTDIGGGAYDPNVSLGQFAQTGGTDGGFPAMATEGRQVLVQLWFLMDGSSEAIPFSEAEVEAEHDSLLNTGRIGPASEKENHASHSRHHEALLTLLPPEDFRHYALLAHIADHTQFGLNATRRKYPYGRTVITCGAQVLYDAPHNAPFLPVTLLPWRSIPMQPYGVGETLMVEAAQREANLAASARARWAARFPHPIIIADNRAKFSLEGRRNALQGPLLVPSVDAIRLEFLPQVNPELTGMIGEAVQRAQFVVGLPDAAMGIAPVSERLSSPGLESLVEQSQLRTGPKGKELHWATEDASNKFLWYLFRKERPRYVRIKDSNPLLAQTLIQMGEQIGVTPEQVASKYIWVDYKTPPKVRVKVRSGKRMPPSQASLQAKVLELLKTGAIAPTSAVFQHLLFDVLELPNREQFAILLEQERAQASEQQAQMVQQQLQLEIQKMRQDYDVKLKQIQADVLTEMASVQAKEQGIQTRAAVDMAKLRAEASASKGGSRSGTGKPGADARKGRR